MTVRVTARQDVRTSRGWVYTPDVDDAPSECALDDFKGSLLSIYITGDCPDKKRPNIFSDNIMLIHQNAPNTFHTFDKSS